MVIAASWHCATSRRSLPGSPRSTSPRSPTTSTSPLFTEHQRHCLAYAEQYVIDVHGITDADAAAVKQESSDDQYVAFTVALGLFDGLGRMRLALGVDESATAPTTVPVSPAH